MNVNYKAAVNMLKERIDNRKLVIDLHYTHLMDISTVINKVSSLHVTYDTIEQHLKSLNALGENTNQKQIMLIIQLKGCAE